MSAPLQCACNKMTWLTVSASTVSALVNHWARGHKVSCVHEVRSQVIALCQLLKMTNWKPESPVTAAKRGITPHDFLLRSGAVFSLHEQMYIFKGKRVDKLWLDNQSDARLTDYFKDVLDVDEVIRRG